MFTVSLSSSFSVDLVAIRGLKNIVCFSEDFSRLCYIRIYIGAVITSRFHSVIFLDFLQLFSIVWGNFSKWNPNVQSFRNICSVIKSLFSPWGG